MTQHDYNRTDDPLMRGWTRKQPRRSCNTHAVLIAAALIFVASLLAATLYAALVLGATTVHGAPIQTPIAVVTQLAPPPMPTPTMPPAAYLPIAAK